MVGLGACTVAFAHAISRLAVCWYTSGSACVGIECHGISRFPSVHMRGHTGAMCPVTCTVHSLPGCARVRSTARIESAGTRCNSAHARLMVSAVLNGDVGRRMANASAVNVCMACRTHSISGLASIA